MASFGGLGGDETRTGFLGRRWGGCNSRYTYTHYSEVSTEASHQMGKVFNVGELWMNPGSWFLVSGEWLSSVYESEGERCGEW